MHAQLGGLVGAPGVFHYIFFKLRERMGLTNTMVTLSLPLLLQCKAFILTNAFLVFKCSTRPCEVANQRSYACGC